MSFDIEALIAGVISTVKTGVPAFKSVAEPDEKLPQSSPFCLVEYLGGPIELGNLEDWTHEFRITAGVHRKSRITQERKAVRALRLSLITALRASVIIDEGFLMSDAHAGGAQQLQYGDPSQSFMGCIVTVRYQTTEGVAHLISD